MRLSRLAIAAAPALFVLLWSTGFIGVRYGLPYIEPLGGERRMSQYINPTATRPRLRLNSAQPHATA
jgi:hypothetical protein